MGPFLALITPLGGGTEPPTPQPPGIWGPSDPRPTLPIAGWNPGTGNFPQPPGGGAPPVPSHPIYGNFPQFPIHYPPGTRPPWAGGGHPPIVVPPEQPPGIWGPGDPRPTLPISGWDPGTGQFPKPPDGGGEGEREPKFEAKVGWSEQTGWVVVFVPTEGTLVPTPSDAEQKAE